MVMKMNPGKLNKRIIFQGKEEVKGPDGDVITQWVDKFTLWGSFVFIKGREYFQAAATNSAVEGESEIRFREDVTSDMRIKYKEKMYDIISVIPTENHTLLIMWKHGGMNG